MYKNKPINKKGPINQSRNFPLLRLRRHNEPEEGCGTLPGIVGFLEMILSIIDPLTIHNNVTLKLYFYLHVQLWFEFSLVVSHWWATMCASSKNPSIHKLLGKAKPALVDPSVSAFPTDTMQSPGEPSFLQGTLLLRRERRHKNSEEKGKIGLFSIDWVI